MNAAAAQTDVSSPPELRFADRMRALKPSAIREILKTTEAPHIISFAGGLPAPELFPVEAIRVATDRVLARDGAGALQYGVTEGYTPLREWVAAHIGETVGLQASAAQVLITHGSQQGLDLLGKTLLNPGDTVVVELPAYLGALQAFQAYQANIVGVPSDAEGVRVDALRAALGREPRPKFLYLISNYQNPTGTSLSRSRRSEVARVAEEFGVLVVEDDPYGRLRFSGDAAPALCASAQNGRWVYLGSASKILAPGLRVAWLVTPARELFERLVTAKQAADLHTSAFAQRVVTEAVADRDFLPRHVARLCSVYGARRDVMLSALPQHLPSGSQWTRPDGGLFLWVTLPEGLDTLALLQKATESHVAFVPGAPFWAGQGPSNTMRLNFSNATEARIQEGIASLGRLVRAAQSKIG